MLTAWRSAAELRIQWMRLMDADDEEIAESLKTDPATDVEDEQENPEAAIRLGCGLAPEYYQQQRAKKMTGAKNYAVHCDGAITFHEKLEEADRAATEEISISRASKEDGWDEELAEGIVVMQVLKRATKVDPDAYYLNVDYELTSA